MYGLVETVVASQMSVPVPGSTACYCQFCICGSHRRTLHTVASSQLYVALEGDAARQLGCFPVCGHVACP